MAVSHGLWPATDRLAGRGRSKPSRVNHDYGVEPDTMRHITHAVAWTETWSKEPLDEAYRFFAKDEVIMNQTLSFHCGA